MPFREAILAGFTIIPERRKPVKSTLLLFTVSDLCSARVVLSISECATVSHSSFVRTGGRLLSCWLWFGARRRIHTKTLDLGSPRLESSHLSVSSSILEGESALQRNSSCPLIQTQKTATLSANVLYLSCPSEVVLDNLLSLLHPLRFCLEEDNEALWLLFKTAATSKYCCYPYSVVMISFKPCFLLVVLLDDAAFKTFPEPPHSPLRGDLHLTSRCKAIIGLLVVSMNHSLQCVAIKILGNGVELLLAYQVHLWLLILCCWVSCLHIFSSLEMYHFASCLEMSLFASFTEMSLPVAASVSEMSPSIHPTRERPFNSVGCSANDVRSLFYTGRCTAVRRLISSNERFLRRMSLLPSLIEDFTLYAPTRASANYTAIWRALIGRLRAAKSWSLSGECEASMVEHLDLLDVEDSLGDYRQLPKYSEDLSLPLRPLALVAHVMLNFSFEDGKSLPAIVVTETKCLFKFVEMESTLIQMLGEDDCKPDTWTMNSTLRAFGGNGQIAMMENCYEKFHSSGIEPNIKTFNILLDSYGKTGNYKKMSAVMEYMQKYHYSWTIVTYNVVIDAFGRAGDLKQMEYLFRLMQSEKIKPSCVTLCSLVRAYGRAGKADKIGGVLRFIENSDIRLDLVFFNCLVDAYGRMEKFAEMKGVLELMEKKGFKPDKITYRTMVKAYRISGMTSHVKELHSLIESVSEAKVVLKKPDF